MFSEEEENIFKMYLQRSSEIMFGLTPQEVRKLAHLYAVKFDISAPSSWSVNGMAGIEWFRGFLQRNKDLSVRLPESTSLARMSSFNKENVRMFLDKVSEVLSRNNYSSSRIWNMDETGVTTVMKQNKVVAQKRNKTGWHSEQCRKR